MALLTPTPYAALTDLTDYSIDSVVLGSLSSQRQQKLLDAANAKIDSYLSAKFVLPLVSWSADLTQCAADLAAFGAIARRGFDPEDEGDKVFKSRADSWEKWLQMIAKGDVSPNVLDSAPGGQGGSGGIGYTSQATVDSADLAQQSSMGTQVSVGNGGGSGQVSVGAPLLRGW